MKTTSANVQTAHNASLSQAFVPMVTIDRASEIKNSIGRSNDLPSNLYAIVDAALDGPLWQRLSKRSQSSRPLLQASADAKSASVMPHLIQFATLAQDTEIEALTKLPPSPAFTLLTSPLSLDQLHAHFQLFLDIHLSGDLSIILAFWDPAILGTLVGQADDQTLHVPGPVLSNTQLQDFLRPISGWWYADRQAHWHSIDISSLYQPDSSTVTPPSRLELTQEQEDLLIEANLPDQILYRLELNQPLLFPARQPHYHKYHFVRVVLAIARQLGLTGMSDQVNFTALCLAYRQCMQTDKRILQLLDQVCQKQITLDQAMQLMPK